MASPGKILLMIISELNISLQNILVGCVKGKICQTNVIPRIVSSKKIFLNKSVTRING